MGSYLSFNVTMLRLILLFAIIFLATGAPVPEEWEVSPEEGDFFEGDIDMSTAMLRNAMKSRTKRWPGGVVPYVISSAYSSRARSTILSGLKEIEAMTRKNGKACITFKPRTNEAAYVNVQRLSGCSSAVGRTGRAQTLRLGPGCESKGITMHEFLHALGFWHEQSRADRDNYVTIHYDNIQKGREHNFRKYGLSQVDHLGQKYDYGSLMHYGPRSFAQDRSKPTISAKQKGATFGQRSRLSSTDIKMVQLLYGC